MNIVAIILVLVVFFVLAGVAGYAWMRYRKILREAKNYERGLKMVPLLIHLPPSSEDTDGGARDYRDVTEETISKAQVLYDIIASTAVKGFKSKFYGQRHISFEIVAVHGRVHFYSAVPVALVDIVKQAVISAYPSATLEEVSEHNIFSPVGKISGTIGGELVLKEDYMHPIATFEESKRDAMQSLLNALSSLGEEDGAGIQIMMRPAHEGWAEIGKEHAKQKKEGKDGGGGGMDFFKQMGTALWKPPESKDDGGGGGPKQLTNLEQSEIDAIESKTKHAAYETLIRVVASSNTNTKARTILNNVVATFALFDAPGKNGFKFSEARDTESFVTAYIMRFFPPEVNDNILNSVELATVFHFPDQSNTPTSQLERQASKQVDGPRNVPDQGMLLGYNVFRGVKKEIRLSDNDRRRHLYLVGQTGTGKSTILENLALQDMIAGKGFAFVDPHGDAVDRLMSMVPKERTEDIVYFNPADMDYPVGLNLFEFSSPEQKDFLIQEAINMLYKLYDPQRQGIIGPRYEHWFRNASLTLMSDPNGSTFIDIPKVFTDNQYAKQKLQYVTDQTVLDFWNKEMAQTSDYHKSEVLGWFVSKFGAFLSNEMMRNIIGQTKSSFDLREIMDQKKILLVNLSKGKTGELNSKLLGMVFVMKFQAAAMSRANVPEDQRVDFSLYVDEFQNFSTDSFATILSEARKYRLNLIVANQFISQLTDEIRDAVFGNVGSVVSFRTGATDADFLVKQFSPVFDVDDLVKLPNFNTVVRMMIEGVPTQPFSMNTLPPLGHTNPQLADAVKRLSAAKYGKPRKVVEQEIFARMETKTPERKPYKPPTSTAGAAKAGAGTASGASGQPSFLDDWLAKRKARVQRVGKKQPSAEMSKNIDERFTPKKAVPQSPTQQPQMPPPRQLNTSPLAQNEHAHEIDQSKVVHDQPKTQKPAKPQEITAQPTLEELEDRVHAPIPQANLNTGKTPAEPIAKKPKVKPVKTDNETLSGEEKDRQDITSISNIIKKDLKKGKPKADDKEKQTVPTEMPVFSDDDSMYIDKDGNIHYKEGHEPIDE